MNHVLANLQTDQRLLSLSSEHEGVKQNPDGSYKRAWQGAVGRANRALHKAREKEVTTTTTPA